MDVSIKLARALQEVATQGEQTDAIAGKVLGIIRNEDIKRIDTFDSAVREAYERNGWNPARGRPKEGSEATPVPVTVKTYVSIIRSGFKERLQPWKYSTIYELRTAVREVRKKAEHPNVVNLFGVKVKEAATMTGELFHDLAVVYQGLTEDQQAMMERQIKRLLGTYSKKADVQKAA